ncbi:MAG: 6-bladed beta-propeller, partial [Gemmatimonadota bacterium]
MKRAAWMMSIAIVAVYGPTSVGAQEVAELPAEDRRLRAVTEGVYEVGGIDAPEWAAFADVDAVEFDGRGRLYVLDSRSHRVVVVGPEGGRVREVGREGEGPGEFRAPRDLAVTPEGDVVVVDVLRRRLSHFGVDGELVADVPADLGDGMPRSIFPHPYGGVVGDAIVYLSTGEPRVRMGDRYRSIDHRPIQRYVIEGDGDVEVLHGARLAPPPVDERGRPYLT